jgi:hypothetical protein
MSTGCRAFRRKTRTSLIAAIVSSQPAPLVDSAADAGLRARRREVLAKDRDDRW